MSTEVITAITTGTQTMVTQLVTMVTGVLPIGLTIVGLSIGVAYAIKFIKKIVK